MSSSMNSPDEATLGIFGSPPALFRVNAERNSRKRIKADYLASRTAATLSIPHTHRYRSARKMCSRSLRTPCQACPAIVPRTWRSAAGSRDLGFHCGKTRSLPRFHRSHLVRDNAGSGSSPSSRLPSNTPKLVDRGLAQDR
jgi:hypothetical protein